MTAARRLAAILAADVVGYSRLMGVNVARHAYVDARYHAAGRGCPKDAPPRVGRGRRPRPGAPSPQRARQRTSPRDRLDFPGVGRVLRRAGEAGADRVRHLFISMHSSLVAAKEMVEELSLPKGRRDTSPSKDQLGRSTA